MSTPELLDLVNRFLDHYHPGDPAARNDLLVIVGASMDNAGKVATEATSQAIRECFDSGRIRMNPSAAVKEELASN